MVIADTRARNRILLVLFVGVLMGALDIAIVGPALPAIQADYRADERTVAWVFTIYVLFNLVGTPLIAKLSDTFGRRSIYLLSVSLFAAGSLIVAFAPSFEFVLAGRAVQGFGAGGIFPVAAALIGDTFPPEKRGSALGLIGAVFGIAFLIGPIIGGVLLLFSWHWLFLVNIPIALGVMIAAMRVLPASRPGKAGSFDWPGMTMLAVLLASMAYGLNRIDTANVTASLASASVWPFLVVPVVLLPAFWFAERRAPNPILRVELIKSRQIALAGAFAIGAGLGEAAVVFVPKLLTTAFGVSESTASFMLLPVVLAMAVGAPTAGKLLDRYGSRAVVLAGNGLVALGMLLVALIPITRVSFYIAAILVGLGLSALLGAPLRYIVLGEAAPSERASSQAALTLFTSTGQLAGGALVGAVAASAGGGAAGYQEAYLVVGAIAVVLTVLAFWLKSRADELSVARENHAAHKSAAASPPVSARGQGGV